MKPPKPLTLLTPEEAWLQAALGQRVWGNYTYEFAKVSDTFDNPHWFSMLVHDIKDLFLDHQFHDEGPSFDDLIWTISASDDEEEPPYVVYDHENCTVILPGR